MQFLSEKMSRHLSSLAPGFEGHWWWVDTGFKIRIFCESEYEEEIERCNRVQAGGHRPPPRKKICPAWQVEDLLRNLKVIALKMLWTPERYMQFGTAISLYLYEFPDTAYQKIEEYLWSILK